MLITNESGVKSHSVASEMLSLLLNLSSERSFPMFCSDKPCSVFVMGFQFPVIGDNILTSSILCLFKIVTCKKLSDGKALFGLFVIFDHMYIHVSAIL